MSQQKLSRYKSRETGPEFSKRPSRFLSNSLVKELDFAEIFEWAHLKFLKSQRFLRKRKYEETIEFLAEILNGIDCKNWEETEFSQKLRTRLQEEIQLPALKKLLSLLIESRRLEEALEICEKVLSLEDSENCRNLRVSLKKALQSSKQSETQGFCGGIAIEMPTFSKLQKSEDENEEKSTLHGSEDERVLHYDDELEDLQYMGVFRYLVYPLKKAARKFAVFFQCLKRKPRDFRENPLP